jgi:cell division protein FtsB
MGALLRSESIATERLDEVRKESRQLEKKVKRLRRRVRKLKRKPPSRARQALGRLAPSRRP